MRREQERKEWEEDWRSDWQQEQRVEGTIRLILIIGVVLVAAWRRELSSILALGVLLYSGWCYDRLSQRIRSLERGLSGIGEHDLHNVETRLTMIEDTCPDVRTQIDAEMAGLGFPARTAAAAATTETVGE